MNEGAARFLMSPIPEGACDHLLRLLLFVLLSLVWDLLCVVTADLDPNLLQTCSWTASRRPSRPTLTTCPPSASTNKRPYERSATTAIDTHTHTHTTTRTATAFRGALYLRPIVFGSGPALGVAPSPIFTFVIYASPVGNYFKGGIRGINLITSEDVHRCVCDRSFPPSHSPSSTTHPLRIE
jgi:hypothetical protein